MTAFLHVCLAADDDEDKKKMVMEDCSDLTEVQFVQYVLSQFFLVYVLYVKLGKLLSQLGTHLFHDHCLIFNVEGRIVLL